MALDEPKEDDEVFNENGVTFIINKELFEEIKPVNVDYVKTAMSDGFMVKSGMANNSGCESSCSNC
jgi:Fe-S cluster assembly iron-binding protein IscA